MEDCIGAFQGNRVERVWNKGISARCDRRIPDDFPDGLNYSSVPRFAGALASSRLPDNLISNPDCFRDIRDGELVWVRVSWLRSFVQQVLPLIRNRFILVTGDSDSCVPSEMMPEAREILASSNLLHWYAQNYDGTFAPERISCLPIGIDFHTIAERAVWGESQAAPKEQECVLETISRGLLPTEHRIPKVYVDFAWRRGRGFLSYRRFHPFKGTEFLETRFNLAKRLRKNDQVHCQPGPLSRSRLWEERGKYAFVLSPHGVGLDCHRTWESLALGHIVLVPSSSLDPLFEGLPVIPLKDWNEINAENLRKWLSMGPLSRATKEKLTSDYWIDQMRSNASSLLRQAPKCPDPATGARKNSPHGTG